MAEPGGLGTEGIGNEAILSAPTEVLHRFEIIGDLRSREWRGQETTS